LTIRSTSEFENLCKDDESCPDNVVGAFRIAIFLYALPFIVLSIVQGLRGFALQRYASFHYLDLFGRDKNSCLDRTLFCSAKAGVSWQQNLILIFNFPAFFWLLYYDQSIVAPRCGNAKQTNGEQWELPRDVFFWILTCISLVGFLLIASSIARLRFKIRPELWSPQPYGSHLCLCCGVRYDCPNARAESCCNSSALLGNSTYLSVKRYFLHFGGLRESNYCCWYPVWFCIYVSNIFFWVTCGIIGTIFENFALYKHFISI